jgi:CheY-like chemotaxis protein
MNIEPIDILLVEDDVHDAELTIRALLKSGINNPLLHVKDGEEAINFMYGKGHYSNRNAKDLPRLILLDLKMPKVDGIEVLRVLKTDEHLKKVPVVLLTSSKEGKDVRECYSCGVNSYIVKPVDFDSYKKSVTSIAFYWLSLNQLPY